MDRMLLPENVISLLKPDLRFLPYNISTISLCSLTSLLIKVFSSMTHALLRFHFYILPRPIVCQAAWCQARLSLPVQPPSLRLLNTAICCSPPSRTVSLTVWKKALNAVKVFRGVHTLGRQNTVMLWLVKMGYFRSLHNLHSTLEAGPMNVKHSVYSFQLPSIHNPQKMTLYNQVRH